MTLRDALVALEKETRGLAETSSIHHTAFRLIETADKLAAILPAPPADGEK